MTEEIITTITPDVRGQVRQILDSAAQVVIGAGWGLSYAAGTPAPDAPLAAEFAMLRQAGIETYAQAEAALTVKDERFWGYWFRRIQQLRFNRPHSKLHDALLTLVEDKDYMVLTTAIDGLFYKSHVDTQRVYPLCGDLSRLQCAQDCCGETYSVLPYLRQALPRIDKQTLALPIDFIPRCPHCGAVMVPNISSMAHFCNDYYNQQARRLNHYLYHLPGALVLLEAGVGYSEPNQIRFPFEFVTDSRDNVTLIRINDRYPLCAEENRAKAICIGMDIADALPALAGQ